MVQYCIEVTLAWTIFYLVYLLLLRRETFFRANRWYLIHTLWLGALLPYLRKLPFSWPTSDSLIHDSVHYVSMGTQVVVDSVTVTSVSSGWDLEKLILGIYLLGVGVTLIRLITGLYKIANLYQRGMKEQRGTYTLITSREFHLPFSFFRYVFLHESFLEDNNLKQIISHEMKHVYDLHTIDILFLELIAITFWWNPIVYLYKREIKQNHEYIADAYASQNSSIKNYGQILLGHSSSGIELALTHQFFNSHLKKRINMLYTTKSARYKMSKYLVVLPCFLFLALLFSSNTLLSETEAQLEHSEEISPLVTDLSLATQANNSSQKVKRSYKVLSNPPISAIKDTTPTKATPIKTIITPNKRVSERTFYTDEMTDPLIIINGEISDSDLEHFFTASKIENVKKLGLKEGLKKYGTDGEKGVLVFNMATENQNITSDKLAGQEDDKTTTLVVINDTESRRITKTNSAKVTKISNGKISAQVTDCENPVIIIDGEAHQDFEGIIPGNIKSVDDYKDNVPSQFSQYKDHCAVIVLSTRPVPPAAPASPAPPATPVPDAEPVHPAPPAPPVKLRGQSEYLIDTHNLDPESVLLSTDNIQLEEVEDYEVDYEKGKINPKEEAQLSSDQQLNIKVKEKNDDHNKTLKVIGNPVKNGTLKFTYKSSINANLSITLFDLNGKKIKEQYKSYPKGGLNGTISLDGVQPGQYFVSVKQGKSLSTQKFVVQ